MNKGIFVKFCDYSATFQSFLNGQMYKTQTLGLAYCICEKHKNQKYIIEQDPHFSINCESLKSIISWNFKVINWSSYIVSYFKPIK